MPHQDDAPRQAKTLEASEAERRIYGDLFPDVQLLRERGLLVARFKGDYRVGTEVLTAAELRRRAAELRKSGVHAPRPVLATSRHASPNTPAPEPIEAPLPAPPKLCGCGKPTNHMGMCAARWATRKQNNGPTGNRAAKPVTPAAGNADPTGRLELLEARVTELERRLARGRA